MGSKQFNLIAFIIFSASILMGLYAQGGNVETDEFSDTEKLLRLEIATRNRSLPNITKKNILIDSLTSQVEDLTDLIAILDNRIEYLTVQLNKTPELDYSIWPLPLLTEDITIFKSDKIKGKSVPAALQKHYSVVCIVTDIDSLLNATDAKINEISDFARKNNLDANELIQKAIEKSVNQLYELFTQLKNCDLSTLSEKQKAYIDSLKQHYNDLSQYYE